jgi:hypothetical protein
MSKKEFDRLEVLLGVRSGRLRVADACKALWMREDSMRRPAALFPLAFAAAFTVSQPLPAHADHVTVPPVAAGLQVPAEPGVPRR